jgi:type IV pilus assembly protein PilQ
MGTVTMPVVQPQDGGDPQRPKLTSAPDPDPTADPEPAVPVDNLDVSVTTEGIVEMHIQDGDLYVVLQQLLLNSRRNIVFGKDVGGPVTVSLYHVTIEQALDAILRPNGFGYREEGNFIFVHTLEELEKILDEERVPVTQTFRLNYISPADAATFIRPILTPSIGSITFVPLAGGGAGGSGQGTTANTQSLVIEDVIMVHDYEDKLWQIEHMLADLDHQPKQVLVEATILRATLNEKNDLGIDFNIVGGVDFKLLAAVDGRTWLIPNTANSESGAGGGGTANNLPPAANFGAGSANQNLGSLNNQVPTSKLNDTTFGIGTDFAGNVPSGGLTFGLVTDHVSMFIRALESVADVAVMSNPKVPVLNKQEVNFLVGSRDGFLTAQVTTETATTQSVDFLETGTQLRFRPFITDDGYVRMRVTPSDSTGGVDIRGLPFERTTEVTTDILVKDGHTILIGGLFREVSSTGRSQIPGLGSLPGIGPAFRSTSDSMVREEVIILLTVHIIDDQDEYAAYSEELLDDMERLRVGIRESMQFHGRERLAQANYHSALDYASRGEWDKAEWHTKLAIHNRPTFVDAIKLREDILQKRSWDHTGTTSRNFVRKLILRKAGLPTELYGIPELPTRDHSPPEVEPDPEQERESKPANKEKSKLKAIPVSAPAEDDFEEFECFDEYDAEPEECFDDFEDDTVDSEWDEEATDDNCEEDELAPEDQVCEGDE